MKTLVVVKGQTKTFEGNDHQNKAKEYAKKLLNAGVLYMEIKSDE
jgi:hypothetical protein